MPASQSQIDAARRRLRKFLQRVQRIEDGPVHRLRSDNGRDLAFELVWHVHSDGSQHVVDFRRPDMDRRTLDSVIVDCRVFFLVGEDCYLPSVVKALRLLAGPERSVARRPLADMVNNVIKDGRLVAPIMASGRLEMDNGLGPGRLLGDDQIAMDYIYGVALHEDDERLARLQNVSGDDTVRLAVLLQMNQLLHVIENVRAQLQHDLDVGHYTID